MLQVVSEWYFLQSFRKSREFKFEFIDQNIKIGAVFASYFCCLAYIAFIDFYQFYKIITLKIILDFLNDR